MLQGGLIYEVHHTRPPVATLYSHRKEASLNLCSFITEYKDGIDGIRSLEMEKERKSPGYGQVETFFSIVRKKDGKFEGRNG